jgi:hypothetical protein
MINENWDLIESLEQQLAAKGDAVVAAVVAAVTPAASVKVDLTKTTPAKVATPELFGVNRSAAAQREGRTQKPAVPGDCMPESGWGRSARAMQKKLNSQKS